MGWKSNGRTIVSEYQYRILVLVVVTEEKNWKTFHKIVRTRKFLSSFRANLHMECIQKLAVSFFLFNNLLFFNFRHSFTKILKDECSAYLIVCFCVNEAKK